MKFGSVCSGIEAASVAWHPLGWRAAWLSEIEAFPSAVLEHHYPDVPNLGDMTTLPDRILSGEVEAPDLFCGGTPCQAFSVAGLRNSLNDARGNLTLTFVGIANAIDHVRSVRRDAPAVIFWENVPGVLSTKDNAFGCFLGALAGEDGELKPSGGKWTNAGCVYGPQRAVAWRVLDAQYFGVAQRRRRVFVVASARDDFDPAAVLFEWDGVRRDFAPSREAGKVAPTIPSRSTAGGGLGTDFDLDGGVITMAHGQGGAEIGFDRGPTLTCNHEAPIAAYSSTTHTLRGEGFDASEDGTGRGTPLVPISIHPHCIGRGPENGPQGKEYLLDGSAYCLDSRGQPQAVVQPIGIFQDSEFGVQKYDSAGTLRAGRIPEHQMVMQPVAVAQPAIGWDEELNASVEQSGTLLRGGQGGRHDGVLTPAMAVRRLTPVECERLQGFPDGYTAISWRKKPASECPDGPRYKALGNSWAVPVVRWIGQRIANQLKPQD